VPATAGAWRRRRCKRSPTSGRRRSPPIRDSARAGIGNTCVPRTCAVGRLPRGHLAWLFPSPGEALPLGRPRAVARTHSSGRSKPTGRPARGRPRPGTFGTRIRPDLSRKVRIRPVGRRFSASWGSHGLGPDPSGNVSPSFEISGQGLFTGIKLAFVISQAGYWLCGLPFGEATKPIHKES